MIRRTRYPDGSSHAFYVVLALTASLLRVPAAAQAAEFGLEGIGVVSTPGSEVRASVFARSTDVENAPITWLAHCDGGGAYADVAPWPLPFDAEAGFTLGPTVDASHPREMLVSGAVPAPKAGKLDIYRVTTPATHGRDGCL